MILDSSDDEESDEGVLEPVKDIDSHSDTIIDVPEYAAEIHRYLKEAEVTVIAYCILVQQFSKLPSLNKSGLLI